MERRTQPVAAGGDGFRLFSRFRAPVDSRAIAARCNPGAPAASLSRRARRADDLVRRARETLSEERGRLVQPWCGARLLVHRALLPVIAVKSLGRGVSRRCDRRLLITSLPRRFSALLNASVQAENRWLTRGWGQVLGDRFSGRSNDEHTASRQQKSPFAGLLQQ